MGSVCPEGQEVADRKSGDQMDSGPNESQPKYDGCTHSNIQEQGP